MTLVTIPPPAVGRAIRSIVEDGCLPWLEGHNRLRLAAEISQSPVLLHRNDVMGLAFWSCTTIGDRKLLRVEDLGAVVSGAGRTLTFRRVVLPELTGSVVAPVVEAHVTPEAKG
ncbi:MAG: hypothetical protein ACRD1G_13480, partial [Acidimicrobiales bacterium]